MLNMMKDMRNIVLFCFICVFFLAVSVIFNISIWKDIFISGRSTIGMVGDNIITEFITETGYQKLLQGKNPISSTNTIFYPFQTNFALNDASYVHIFFFMFLRLFFDPYVSILVIVVFNFFLSNLIMFLLLRKLRISIPISFIFALVYGFMPFISYRVMGHYTYTPLYLFPLIFLLGYEILFAKKKLGKFVASVGFGCVLALTLFFNFYYIAMVFLGITGYVAILFFLERRKFLLSIKENILYIFVSAGVFLLLLTPWLLQVKNAIELNGVSKTEGFGGAQMLSGGFFNFFMPSEYNPFYSTFAAVFTGAHDILGKAVKFFEEGFTKSTYPGIIILLSYFSLIFFKKNFSLRDWQWIKPYFILSIIFAIFAMGPFFKLFNNWFIVLDEGIRVYLPLPYIIFHYIPILNSLRAPMRFTPMFVFFAVIVSSYIVNKFFIHVSVKKRIYIFSIMLVVFLFDQFYQIPLRTVTALPLAAYSYIQKDPQSISVLEIPFTVRDGFQYLGFVHAISPMKGQLIHKKPVLGGYIARVQPYIFDYYKNLPLIGYFLKIIDKGNYNPDKEEPKDPVVTQFLGDFALAKQEVAFLDIKYILLKNDEKYTDEIRTLIKAIDFQLRMEDGKYDLYEKKVDPSVFDSVYFGEQDDYLYTGSGFSIKENGYRWVDEKSAQVFLKSGNIPKKKLIFEIESFNKLQNIQIYINAHYIGAKKIQTERQQFTIDIGNNIKPGMNIVFFKFSQTFKPSDVLQNSKDGRSLAAKFFSLKMK